MKRAVLIAALVIAACGVTARGQFGTDELGLNSPTDPGGAPEPQPLEVAALSEYEAVSPGQRFLVALTVDIDPEYYFYSPAPGSTEEVPVTPAGLEVRAEGFEHIETLWPPDTPETLDVGGLTARNNVYKGRIVIFARFKVTETSPGEIRLQLTGQVCSKGGLCIPLDRFTDPAATRARLTPTVAPGPLENPAWADLDNPEGMLEQARTAQQLRSNRKQEDAEAIVLGGLGDLSIWAALGLALVVGLTLNIMPCVLPVIPLRIYSIVNMAGESRRRVVGLGMAFAFGILLFFLVLAALNAGLNLAAQQALDWSAMWKYPLMRSGMIVLLVIVAANLFGLFTVTVPNKVAQIEAQNNPAGGGYASSIGMGLMMAILSTPCSFGLLLGVLGWSQTQPLAVATLVFTFMGLGMALPHALLVAYPKLLEKLPKPGVWMEHFKQSMGFIVLLVGAYLLHTLTESPYAAWVAAFAIVLSAGLWVWDKWVKYTDPMRKKLLVRGTTVVILILAGIWMLQPPQPGRGVNFVEYDETVLSQAQQDDRPVLLKFTASWCTSCKSIERNVFNKPRVAQFLAQRNVLSVEVDVTNNDSPGDKFMRRRYGTGAPPLTVLLPAGDGRPVQLLGSYSIEQLEKAFEQAGIAETPGQAERGE